jgi:hypothetical protein
VVASVDKSLSASSLSPRATTRAATAG